MEVFGMSALFGLILGFMFGVGCAFCGVIYDLYGWVPKSSGRILLLADKRRSDILDNLDKVSAKLGKDALHKPIES